MNKKLKILFVASEALPFAKAGGLGDVMFSLPLALRKLGQDARVMIPRYRGIDSKKYKLKTVINGLKVPTDQPAPTPQYLICNVKQYKSKKTAPTYFLENMEYYEKRANVYGYADDHIRWALLSRGVIEFLKVSTWKPDIIIASDWQTALIPNYLKTIYKNNQSLSKIRVVLAIHNLRYQGMRDFKFSQETKRDSGTESIPDFFNPRLGDLNWLLRGIIYSDAIVVVSPTYAKEILTPKYGEGLDKILSENQGKIYGILNGFNPADYNPEKDQNIPFNYNIKTISKKKNNKLFLQKKFGLKQDPNIFLIGIVSRLTEQKGLNLLEKIIQPVLSNLSIQIISVGDGENRYKEMFKKAKESYPDKVAYHLEFNTSLPHLVFSGADALLMPSKFEPCGISQMQAMRYGCLPIARKTGGLTDTIEDISPSENKGNGFLFEKYDPTALLFAIAKAHAYFQIKRVWISSMKRAMKKDFSWTKPSKNYISLFYDILNNNHQ